MKKLSLVVLTLTLAACGGDKPEAGTAAASSPSAAAASPDAYRKAQERYADSVLNTVSSASDVAKRLGDKYEAGSTKLRDSVAALVAKADCFTIGRQIDPYLAGTATIWVNMAVIGSDVIRLQESKWTSGAGANVDECLNKAAAGWKFDPSFGKPKAYLVQVQFKTAADSARKAP